MTRDGIKKFLIALGVDENLITEARGWMNAPCPMASARHASGYDERPSFGIRINDAGQSYYYCFGCMPEGRRIIELLPSMWHIDGEYPHEAAKIFMENEIFSGEQERDEEKIDVWAKERRKIPKPVPPLPKIVLDRYPLLNTRDDEIAKECRRFLSEDRKISLNMSAFYGVRYDVANSALIFPLVNNMGEPYVLRCRISATKKIWTINESADIEFSDIEFPKLKHVGAWFGLHLVDWTRPVILVEAELDVLRLATMGCNNAVASATSSVSIRQLEAVSMAPMLLLGYDADKAGRRAHEKICSYFQSSVPLLEIDWSVSKRENGEPCKDPGHLKNTSELKKVLADLRDPIRL
jgi:hypothetical protein